MTAPLPEKSTANIGLPLLLILIVLLPSIGAASAADLVPVTEEIPFTVDPVPKDSRYVVVSFPIDFTNQLADHHVAGTVDPHSLVLYRADDTKTPDQRIPMQWIPDPQPRAKHGLLPATTQSINGPAIPVSGTVVFAGQGGGSHRYVLSARICREGTFLQAPYPPQDWHLFYENGRAQPPAFPVMQVHPQWPVDGVIDLFHNQTRVLGYHIGPTTYPSAGAAPRRPFIYPVIGPDGIPLTEFGKPHDPTGSHAHHYSLWIAHMSVNGHDFWSEKGGAIVHSRLDEQQDGPLFCRVVQSTRWMWEQTDLVHERRTVTLYNAPEDFRLIDFDLEFTCAGKEPVTFGKTTFGFLSARIRQSMTVFDGGGQITNSQGGINEANVHTKHADWIDLAGPIAPGANPGDGDKWGGLAILDHPTNPNHPTMFHCRNDGWACASFTGDAPYVLKPGKPLRLRYRVVLHRGDALAGGVAQHYQDFIQPLTVHLDDR